MQGPLLPPAIPGLFLWCSNDRHNIFHYKWNYSFKVEHLSQMDQKPNIFYKNFAKLCQEKKTVNKCLKENLY